MLVMLAGVFTECTVSCTDASDGGGGGRGTSSGLTQLDELPSALYLQCLSLAGPLSLSSAPDRHLAPVEVRGRRERWRVRGR